MALLALLLASCASLSPQQRSHAEAIAEAARRIEVACTRSDACASPSPVLQMAHAAVAASTAAAPQHRALILDDAPAALLLRVHLIRSAQHSIELQTYIFDEDDAAQLILDELQAAAFRGVKVRILVDQLAALRKVETLAALAALHTNLELRVYNPVLDRARLSWPMYAVAAACCWRQLNQRMHNKLLVVDGVVGITGGRNYQDDYYDWGDDYNFRDRDLLLAGPVVHDMQANFDAFWQAPRSVPAAHLGDVARYLRQHGAPPPPHHPFRKPARVRALLADVDDAATLQAQFVAPALAVTHVSFIADLPRKHHNGPAPDDVDVDVDAHAHAHTEANPEANSEANSNAATDAPVAAPLGAASRNLMQLIAGAQHDVLLQTPYLVLSKTAQRLFRYLHRQPAPPRVQISTNSLAATDAFIAYAMSYKYKRRYLRDFGFQIHEFKPFPADAPFELGKTGADLEVEDDDGTEADTEADMADAIDDDMGDVAASTQATPLPNTARQRRLTQRGLRNAPASEAGRRSPFASSGGLPVRLKHAGLRMGLHAKSMVIDDRIGVVGTHNFDPRGDTWNTESAVVIDDAAFAQRLSASIQRDMAPANAWTIGRRDSSPILPGVEHTLARVSERMPLFDLWPIKYATSYNYTPGPGCPATQQPPSPFAGDFRRCNQPVGDFPEVDLGLKWLGVRLFTAFGAGLSPIL
jgi:phosphatidylserine/phosphatidylglycerophosphate/cardiolipin synthase-like enzyme